jgi:hypothetical protein
MALAHLQSDKEEEGDLIFQKTNSYFFKSIIHHCCFVFCVLLSPICCPHFPSPRAQALSILCKSLVFANMFHHHKLPLQRGLL